MNINYNCNNFSEIKDQCHMINVSADAADINIINGDEFAVNIHGESTYEPEIICGYDLKKGDLIVSVDSVNPMEDTASSIIIDVTIPHYAEVQVINAAVNCGNIRLALEEYTGDMTKLKSASGNIIIDKAIPSESSYIRVKAGNVAINGDLTYDAKINVAINAGNLDTKIRDVTKCNYVVKTKIGAKEISQPLDESGHFSLDITANVDCGYVMIK